MYPLTQVARLAGPGCDVLIYRTPRGRYAVVRHLGGAATRYVDKLGAALRAAYWLATHGADA